MQSSSATGPGARQPSDLGYVYKLNSYVEADAVILQPLDPSLYRGSLVQVYDPSTGSHYLAVISDVAETEPHPAPDPELIEDVLSSMQAATPRNYYDVLRELLSPSSPLTYTTSVVVKLRLLGRICLRQQSGLVCSNLPNPLQGDVAMSDVGRPPRPRSIVSPPDPGILSQLLGCGGCAEIGELRQLPGVAVALDLSRINTHVAVVGQTGSGKTETVKRIVYEAVRIWFGSASAAHRGIVVTDLAGEYTGYPYTPPTATPLLHALSRIPGLRIERLTILVPYEPRLSSPYLLIRGLLGLHQRVVGPVQALTGGMLPILILAPQSPPLVLAPPSIAHSIPGLRATGLSNTYHGDARSVRHLLTTEPALIVATPLPDAMPVELLLEVGGFREDTEYTNLLYDILDALGSTTMVPSVTLLALISMQALRPATNAASLANGLCANLSRGVHAALSTLLANNAPRGYLLRPLARYLAGYPPTGTNLRHALQNLCAVGRRVLESRIGRLLNAQELVHDAAPRTRGALKRRLARIARMASPLLDARTAGLLAQRVAEGFTILHLAPPSTGGVNNPVLHWLLYTLFAYAVRRYERDRRLMIVVEEAHNLAPSGEETFSRMMLERYAREGRKWGIGLVTVTQRPTGISPTILSQSATLIALRLTNPEDIQAVRTASESVTQELVESLPDLNPGEALVSGYALPERRIPVLARIRMVT